MHALEIRSEAAAESLEIELIVLPACLCETGMCRFSAPIQPTLGVPSDAIMQDTVSQDLPGAASIE